MRTVSDFVAGTVRGGAAAAARLGVLRGDNRTGAVLRIRRGGFRCVDNDTAVRGGGSARLYALGKCVSVRVRVCMCKCVCWRVNARARVRAGGRACVSVCVCARGVRACACACGLAMRSPPARRTTQVGERD